MINITTTDGTPLNRFQAEELTKLESVSMPDATTKWLRCKLGQHVQERRQTVEGNYINVRVFHVIGYGATWEAATNMALFKSRKVEIEK